ncbi:MAG: prepilin-type N-terminal cleavage/methylation domain-containing protein [Phycisphaerales bacterium]|nr:prepilin-type N-terminal cleavage/methylation domain-containing protein [Phycisphaerales bacterium]
MHQRRLRQLLPACRSLVGRAFSLIELLVVVAIIAILISILVPGLRESRERGRRAKCAANLHNIGAAWQQYLQSNNDFFMTPGGNVQWFYGGKVEIYAVPGPAPRNPRELNRYLSLDPYGNRAAEIFHCPSDRGAIGLPDAESQDRTTYDYMGNSYPSNAAIATGRRSAGPPGTRYSRPLRLTDIGLPPSIFISQGDHQMYFAGSAAYSAIWHDTDGLSVNLGFLDGHVAFIRMTPGENQTGLYSFATEWEPPEEESGDPP